MQKKAIKKPRRKVSSKARPKQKPRKVARPRKTERVPPVLASEVDLRCSQYRRGTTEPCRAPAVGFLPGVGDTCEECARERKIIRYATTRRGVVEKAA